MNMTKRPVEKYDFKAFGQAIKNARKERKESRKKVSDEMYIFPRYLEHIGVGLVQLGADTAIVVVNQLGQFSVEGKAFLIKQRLLKLTFADRYIADDNHGAAARSDFADFFKVFVLRKAKSGRSKDDTVFQFQTAVIDGTVNRFVHGAVSFLLLFPIRQAAVPFLSQSDSS